MQNIEEIDLSSEIENAADEGFVRSEPYDPRPKEDDARRNIAYILLGLLGLIVYSALLLVLIFPERLPDIIGLLQIIFTPIVTLVSAATGFYYGTKKQ